MSRQWGVRLEYGAHVSPIPKSSQHGNRQVGARSAQGKWGEMGGHDRNKNGAVVLLVAIGAFRTNQGNVARIHRDRRQVIPVVAVDPLPSTPNIISS